MLDFDDGRVLGLRTRGTTRAEEGGAVGLADLAERAIRRGTGNVTGESSTYDLLATVDRFCVSLHRHSKLN